MWILLFRMWKRRVHISAYCVYKLIIINCFKNKFQAKKNYAKIRSGKCNSGNSDIIKNNPYAANPAC